MEVCFVLLRHRCVATLPRTTGKCSKIFAEASARWFRFSLFWRSAISGSCTYWYLFLTTCTRTQAHARPTAGAVCACTCCRDWSCRAELRSRSFLSSSCAFSETGMHLNMLPHFHPCGECIWKWYFCSKSLQDKSRSVLEVDRGLSQYRNDKKVHAQCTISRLPVARQHANLQTWQAAPQVDSADPRLGRPLLSAATAGVCNFYWCAVYMLLSNVFLIANRPSRSLTWTDFDDDARQRAASEHRYRRNSLLAHICNIHCFRTQMYRKLWSIFTSWTVLFLAAKGCPWLTHIILLARFAAAFSANTSPQWSWHVAKLMRASTCPLLSCWPRLTLMATH